MKKLLSTIIVLLVSATLGFGAYTYGQCQAIAKSTGRRCLHGVSKAGDRYCWEHKTPGTPAPKARPSASEAPERPPIPIAEIQSAALAYAQKFYSQELSGGRVITIGMPTPIEGWSGRYSTPGTVAGQPVRRFEVITKVSDEGKVEALDLIKRYY